MSPSIMLQYKTRQGTKTDNRKTDTSYRETTLAFVFPTYVCWWNQEGIKKISQLYQHIFSKYGDKLWPDLCRCRQFIFGREHFAKTSKHHHPTPHRLSAQEFHLFWPISQNLSNVLFFTSCKMEHFSKTSKYHYPTPHSWSSQDFRLSKVFQPIFWYLSNLLIF